MRHPREQAFPHFQQSDLLFLFVIYSVTKLRRLAECIEGGERFQIQVAGERISVPPDAVINIEHERGDGEEELEFQLKWSCLKK